MITRSALDLEPFIARCVRRVVTERPTCRLLEIGCGTGTYVRHVAESCPQLVAVGVDMSERARALAAANFSGWGLAGRCTALRVDVREADIAGLGGPFDVITLHNNVYYFPQRNEIACSPISSGGSRQAADSS